MRCNPAEQIRLQLARALFPDATRRFDEIPAEIGDGKRACAPAK